MLALLAARCFGQLVHLLAHRRPQALGQFVEDVQRAVIPTPLMAGSGEDLVERRPQAQCAIADSQHRCFLKPALLE